MPDPTKRRRLNLDPAPVSNDRNEMNSINPLTGREYSRRYHELLRIRKVLPIHEAKTRILKTIAQNRVTVLQGETGSGKTTQLPQMLVDMDDREGRNGIIACTQPRRVAAMSVARRVADEMDVPIGEQVGYTIRFEDRTNDKTILKYMTDGMLLRETMGDRLLSRYKVVVLDEAHERTVATDVLMGLLKGILRERDDLRVVVMSATLDAQSFQRYFEGAPLLHIPGRVFPVETHYSKTPENDYVEACIRVTVDIVRTQPEGDILVFLTGEEEIEECVRRIDDEVRPYVRAGQIGVVTVLPLYGSLAPDKQQRVFEPAPGGRGDRRGRKIICATNIAETSLTIDGVVYVVDTGFSKQKIYNPRARVETLLVRAISKASASQRTGRAGRTRPGKCYRLYTKDAFEKELQATTFPEILRSNLANVVLQLKKIGIDDLVHFDFMDPPAPETLMRALETLNYLGALDDDGDLTSFGAKMSEFPLSPESAAALMNSPKYNCSEQILTIAAMTSSAQNCFIRPPKTKGQGGKRRGNKGERHQPKKAFEHSDGDHMTLLNVYNAFKEAESNSASGAGQWCWENFINFRALKTAQHTRSQLVRLMRRAGMQLNSTDTNDVEYSENIRRAVLSGYFMQVAFKEGRQRMASGYSKDAYKVVKDNQMVVLHPSCGMKSAPRWVVYDEFVMTKTNYVRTCSEVKGEWLVEMAPHYYEISNFPMGETKNELVRLYRKAGKRGKKNSSGRASAS